MRARLLAMVGGGPPQPLSKTPTARRCEPSRLPCQDGPPESRYRGQVGLTHSATPCLPERTGDGGQTWGIGLAYLSHGVATHRETKRVGGDGYLSAGLSSVRTQSIPKRSRRPLLRGEFCRFPEPAVKVRKLTACSERGS